MINRIRTSLFFCITAATLFSGIATAAPDATAADSTSAAKPTTVSSDRETSKAVSRWEPNIQKFEAQDRATSAPQGGILFVGSSTIVKWKTDKDYPDLPVLNRGFGGSQVSDVLEYFDRVVVPYHPKTIVFYSGDNDISAGKTPGEVFADVQQFVNLVKEKVPSAKHLIIFPPKPSGSRFNLWPKMKEVGQLEKKLATGDTAANDEGQLAIAVIDMSGAMLKPDGTPNDDLFVKDRLHMNAKGYALWNARLRPILEKLNAEK